MKGDFTRFTHNPDQHYTRVLKQQGRVDVDADFNEQAEIQTYLSRTQAVDVIGPRGVPKTGGGFAVPAVAADGGDFTLSPGRLYVDGLLCELEEAPAVSYQQQPDFPSPPALTPQEGRTDLVYVDVWERHLTALEDPDLREVALGGPDTATRVKTVWQVKVLPDVGSLDCAAWQDWSLPGSDGRLTNAATQTPASTDPCTLPPQGGYRGLENLLYRVEVHDGSAPGPATFKWSRDNGAVVFAVEEFINGNPNQVRVKRLGLDQILALHEGDWVELLDDATELRGEPGLLAQISDINEATRLLTLSKPVTGLSLTRHAKVRRWDQASDALAIGPGPLALEHGIEVSFSGATFHTGDYWAFAARTATADIEELTQAPPRGIHHAYCPLALVTWKQSAPGVWNATVIQDCRPPFPPLTQICAEDVCFDNSACQLADADTVQEALDRLCAAHDLRRHHKHLHGWGIVCGLEVACGPDGEGLERRHVTVRPGYALDCEGSDLVLEEPQRLDLMSEIERLIKAAPETPVLRDGDGEVCLTLGLDAERRTTIEVEPYDPQQDAPSLLSGTLWEDFFEDCVQGLLADIGKAFQPPPEQEKLPVKDNQKLIIALVNLLAQLTHPAEGRYVLLAPQEDALLRKFYALLRKLLASKTYCAMFDQARPLPDYPFPKHDLATLFGKDFHSRLRLHPGGQTAYTLGQDHRIHLYDLKKGELAVELEFPGGEGLRVRDVVVSADGKRLYAAATLKNLDTLLAVAEIEGLEHHWRPVSTICGVELVTLALAGGETEAIYAIGKGKGLYRLTPEDIPKDLQPLYGFNAVGHLVLPGGAKSDLGYATARQAGSSPEVYDRVLLLNLAKPGSQFLTFMLPTAPGSDLPLTGRDDIAVGRSREKKTDYLLVVTDPPGGATQKQLAIFNALKPEVAPKILAVENTAIRLAPAPDLSFVVLSFADSYRLALYDLEEGALRKDYRLPVQLSPLSLAAAEKTKRFLVLNGVSNTITAFPLEYLDPKLGEPIPPAGSQDFLNALEAYRTAMYEAFVDLVGGLLQYLKDCFCDHLLIKCPECTAADKIYLACVSLRNHQVHQVCNFSRRKYVKSFPTVEYWLSLVPIIPWIGQMVTQWCCTALPDLFGVHTAPEADAKPAAMTAAHLYYGLNFLKVADVSSLMKPAVAKLALSGKFLGDWLGSRFTQPEPSTRPEVAPGDLVGNPVEEVKQRLEKAEVAVAGVKPYDPAQGLKYMRQYATAPERLAAGARVILYEQDGVIRGYGLEEEPPAALQDLQAKVASQEAQLAEVEGLKGSLAQVPRLQQQLADVEAMKESLTLIPQLQQQVEAQQSTLKEMEAMRQDLADVPQMKRQLQTQQEALTDVPQMKSQLQNQQEVLATVPQMRSQLQSQQEIVADVPQMKSQLQSQQQTLAEMNQIKAQLQSQQEALAEVARLRTSMAAMQEQLAAKDREISGLKTNLKALQESQTTLETKITPRLESMQNQLKTLTTTSRTPIT